jgi:hypothetical protein
MRAAVSTMTSHNGHPQQDDPHEAEPENAEPENAEPENAEPPEVASSLGTGPAETASSGTGWPETPDPPAGPGQVTQ